MVDGIWADASRSPQGSPAGWSAPDGELIGSPETREAANKLAQAESEFKAYPSVLAPTHDADEYKRKEQAYHDAQAAFTEVMAAAAADAAAAATPSSPHSAFDSTRNTHEVARVNIARAVHDLRAELPDLVNRTVAAALAAVQAELPGLVNRTVAAALAAVQAPPTVPTNPASDSNIAGKPSPAPPKFYGDKGDGKVSINAWLLHFLDWCALHSIFTSWRVAYAVQALEGSAVQAWYPRKQQLEIPLGLT